MSGTVTAVGSGVERTGTRSLDGFTVLDQPNDVSSTLCASGAGTDRPSAQGSQEGFCVVSMKTDNTKANGTYISDAPVSYTLDTLAPPAVFKTASVLYPRRLTPLECERLQGFPDGWTDVRFQGKPAKDSHRYRALGNSMAVPVMRWLAEGIREFF